MVSVIGRTSRTGTGHGVPVGSIQRIGSRSSAALFPELTSRGTSPILPEDDERLDLTGLVVDAVLGQLAADGWI
jgi:hypothetical protein